MTDDIKRDNPTFTIQIFEAKVNDASSTIFDRVSKINRKGKRKDNKETSVSKVRKTSQNYDDSNEDLRTFHMKKQNRHK